MEDVTQTWWWGTGAGSSERRVSGEWGARAEAEAWLSSAWEDLLDEGVGEVVLMHGANVVYGPMPLAE